MELVSGSGFAFAAFWVEIICFVERVALLTVCVAI
jgi:hypothetical protein